MTFITECETECPNEKKILACSYWKYSSDGDTQKLFKKVFFNEKFLNKTSDYYKSSQRYHRCDNLVDIIKDCWDAKYKDDIYFTCLINPDLSENPIEKIADIECVKIRYPSNKLSYEYYDCSDNQLLLFLHNENFKSQTQILISIFIILSIIIFFIRILYLRISKRKNVRKE